jgi:steroid delta-isomerase
MNEKILKLIEWYNDLDEKSLEDISEYYSTDCYFKDPFNEYHNLPQIKDLYKKMFQKLTTPRFTITNYFIKDQEAVLFWDFTFKAFKSDMKIQGSTLLKFNHDNKINVHIDYWDSVSELWRKVPIIKYFINIMYKIL